MKILQSVVVKQVLTENSKSELLDKYRSNKQQLQKECDQLRFEMKKLEKTKKFQQISLNKHYEKEIQMRQEKIKLLDFQIEQLHMLPLGSELKEKEVKAIIEIEEGDRWEDVQSGRTIIIQDGIVKEIR
ncbi:YlqD family protein [Bacillus sp. FJAT-49705]|uniref:YlqD family protein n=1 Tax=Cytobacillus citreus TaxID=2833586 RepID=A0ABS5NN22_9BACI|nr:YlqD family protein [Cytobacillus citreus]MBS4189206.1 YlqD family protein [Cytobacillus citreus]